MRACACVCTCVWCVRVCVCVCVGAGAVESHGREGLGGKIGGQGINWERGLGETRKVILGSGRF